MIYAEIEDNLAEMYICWKTKILLSVLQLLVLHKERFMGVYPFRDLFNLKYKSRSSHSRGLFNSMKYQTVPEINENFIYRKL